MAGAFLAAFFTGLPATTASLKAFSGVMRAAFFAGTFTGAPVCGLRAMRGPRSTRMNLAKPVSTTGSPPATVSVTVETNSFSTASTSRLSRSVRSAMAAASSRLFNAVSL